MASYELQTKELQRKYNKELGRIKRLQTSLEKQGYVFPQDNIIPKRPKKITEGSIRKLQKISSKTIARKGLYVNRDTGEVTTGRTQFEKQRKKPKKSAGAKKHSVKKKDKEKSKATRNNHYASSNRKKGTKTPPVQAEEIIHNTFEEITKEKLTEPQQPSTTDNTTQEEVKSDAQEQQAIDFYNNLVNKFRTWEAKPEWSRDTKNSTKSLTTIKTRDVNKAARLIAEAVEKYGVSTVAQRLAVNASEVSELIYQIMYMGSGRTFVEEQNKSQQGLVRLESILSSQTLDLKQTQELNDRMDDWDFDEYIT